jgi:hypothetical protein
VHTSSAVDAVSPDGTVSVHARRLTADLIVAADGGILGPPRAGGGLSQPDAYHSNLGRSRTRDR